MDDVERQAVHGDPEIMEKKRKAKIDSCFCCLAVTLITVFVCGLVIAVIFQLDAHYYVAVDSVSPGLDPTGGLSFNLTLGVSSRSYGAKACIKPGTYVDVSYRGVQLAASEAERGPLCVGPKKTIGQRVAARVTGVPVGQVLDSLTADLKQGVAVFDAKLHLPAGSYGAKSQSRDGTWVSECGGMLVGAGAAWCDAPLQIPT
ncbi:unnamed protein product [Alopecurus aequalis]